MLSVLIDARMAHWSGVGRYTCGLVHALARREDIALSVLASQESLLALGVVNAHVIPAEGNPLLPEGEKEFSEAIVHGGYDLIHCMHYPMPDTKPVTPLVVTLHDLIPLIVFSSMPNPAKRMIYKAKNKKAVSFASRIIAPSHATQQDLEHKFPAAKGKSLVIPEAADDFVSEPAAPTSYPKPYLLAMGNTKAHKNLGLLTEMMSALLPSYPGLTLYLVGREDKSWLTKQLKKHPRLEGHIAFTGFASDGELRGLYKRASVFLFPSLYEGFGLPPLEAMGLGTPVIAANTSSLPEVVGDGGILLDPYDVHAWTRAVSDLLSSPTAGHEIGHKGKQRYALFSWERTAEKTVELYRELLG